MCIDPTERLPLLGDIPPDFLKVDYKTLGNFGQYRKSIAILKNGKIIDPERFIYVPKRTPYKFKINDFEITVYNDSGKKNYYILVEIPADKVMAIVEEVRRSDNFLRGIIYGEGKIITEEMVKENIIGKKKYINTYIVTYYVNGNIKIELSRVKKDTKTELLNLPKVYVSIKQGYITINGDICPIKEILKELEFRWNSDAKLWQKAITSEEEAIKTIEEIKKIARVEVFK